jgi:hypothetical protein
MDALSCIRTSSFLNALPLRKSARSHNPVICATPQRSPEPDPSVPVARATPEIVAALNDYDWEESA